jgi:hypothetical protein
VYSCNSIASKMLLEEGEATGRGRESNIVKVLLATCSWRIEKQQVEVERVILYN